MTLSKSLKEIFQFGIKNNLIKLEFSLYITDFGTPFRDFLVTTTA